MKRSAPAVYALLLGNLALMCSPEVAWTQEGASSAPEVVLLPGDVIRIEMWRQPELSGDFDIASDGSIRHPLYQQVRVGGVPLSQAQARLRVFLSDFVEDPQFVVTPLVRIAIGGEVREPNLYNLRPDVSITEALAGAGGPTEEGRLDRVRLLRGGTESKLDLTRPDGRYDLVRSGDQIFVERRRNVWREVIAPAASITGATAAIISAIVRARN